MTRRLSLRREAIAELASNDLLDVRGASGVCPPVSVLTQCVACPDVVPVTRFVSAVACTVTC